MLRGDDRRERDARTGHDRLSVVVRTVSRAQLALGRVDAAHDFADALGRDDEPNVARRSGEFRQHAAERLVQLRPELSLRVGFESSAGRVPTVQ